MGHILLNGLQNFTTSCDGKWTPIHDCNPKKCPQLTVLSSDTDNFTGQWGDMVKVKCDSGFQVNPSTDSFETRCNEDAKWTPICKCIPRECPSMSIENSNTSQRGGFFNSITTVKCDAGYLVNGTSKSDTSQCVSSGSKNVKEPCSNGTSEAYSTRCMANGQWSINFTCYPRPCHPTLRDQNACPSIIEGHFPDAIEVHCNEGFLVNDSHSSYFPACLASGTWNDTSSKCTPRSCPDLNCRNTNIINEMGHFGDVLKVRCNKGHQVNSSTDSFETRCNENAQWTPIHQCIPIECPSLSIENSNTSQRGGFFKSIITVKCDAGYLVNGTIKNDTSQCISRGSRNAKEPCSNGTSEAYSTTCMANGQWSFNFTCYQRPCHPTMKDQNARPSIIKGHFPDAIEVHCKKGFLVNDSHSSYFPLCLASGTWNDTSSKCTPRSCPDLTCRNTNIINQTGHYGDEMKVRCNKGHQIELAVHNQTVRCLSSGRWMQCGCQKITCSPLSVKNSNVTNHTAVFKSVVSVECDHGFVWKNNTPGYFTECLPDGSWNVSDGCTHRKCPLLNITNSNTTGALGYFSDMLRIQCNAGYQFDKQLYGKTYRCLANGSWSEETAHCKPRPCQRLNILNSNVTAHVGYYQDTVYIKCQQGFQQRGGRVRFASTCLATGMWNDESPCHGE